MHPAYSVILFTTASGAGYGLLIWLALFGALGVMPTERWIGAIGFSLSFGLITAGLFSSTYHLGHPERAWRAFSQWRSSWLSREGVLAVATYVPAGLLALIWIITEKLGAMGAWLALATIILALATVYCTAMIYASLKTIRQWNIGLVPLVYVALALATGSVLLNVLARAFGHGGDWSSWLAILMLALAFALKAMYWMTIDRQQSKYTAEDAIGLKGLGMVRAIEPAHSQPNFVMREMGYRVARRHSERLRRNAIALAFVIPIACCLAEILRGPSFGIVAAVIATISAAIGVVVERWLFFAEAEHIVMLYYGAERA